MPESRQYELVYVISPEVGEEGVTDLHTQVETIVGDLGGRIEKSDNWGRRRLAYEIGEASRGDLCGRSHRWARRARQGA